MTIFRQTRARVVATACLVVSGIGMMAIIPPRPVSSPVASSPTASITFLKPAGRDDSVGQGEDYSANAWAEPWDFSQPLRMPVARDISDFGVSAGSLKGRVSDTNGDGIWDPYFFLLFPGMPGAINLNTGQQNPIDAARYNRVSFRLCASGPRVKLYWYNTTTGYPPAGGSGPIYLQSGCGTYSYDLSDDATWQGTITGLRFDLESFAPEDTFSMDWFRLTAGDDWSNEFTIEWVDLDPAGDTLQLFLDDDASGYDGDQIARVTTARVSGTFSWGSSDTGYLLPQDFQAGEYYVYAEVSGQPAGYSTHPLRISRAPIIVFIDPSRTSGADYATDNGDPWDMDSGSDATVHNCTSHQFSAGRLEGYNTGNDPYIELNTPTPIDTSFYRYFTIDFFSQYSFFTRGGGMARVYWMNDVSSATTTEDMIINLGGEWQTYSLDLSRVPLEATAGQAAWTSNDWSTLRFDPNENTSGVSWRWLIDDVRLTGPPDADDRFYIRWDVENPEKEMITATLYYDSDDSGFDGVPINSGETGAATYSPGRAAGMGATETVSDTRLFLPAVFRFWWPGNSMIWDTSGLPSGHEYFIYGCLDDGVNQTCRYSDAPVLIRR